MTKPIAERRTHYLKYWLKYQFLLTKNNGKPVKRFELRYNRDRNFQVGEIIIPCGLDGRPLEDVPPYEITFVLRDTDFPDGIKEGYCIFSYDPIIEEFSYQPENSRTYSIQEVEQIAREAVANADLNEDDDCADFNAWWWANKLKEINNGK